MQVLLVAALLLLAAPVYAGDTRYVWTNPTFQAKADSCAETDTIPETGLSHALMRLARIDIPDTLDLGQKPLTGPGVSDSIEVSTIDSVWAHVFILRTVDQAGNKSCLPQSYLQVKPVTQWPLPSAPSGPAGLEARYFENSDFTGPTFDIVESVVDHLCPAWDTHNLGPGWFSVQWVGLVTLPVDGTWTFCVDSDDGARLLVDGRMLVDRWTTGRLKACGSSGFSAGLYALQLDYYQNGGDCAARLLFTPPGQAEALVPASALSH